MERSFRCEVILLYSRNVKGDREKYLLVEAVPKLQFLEQLP